MHHSRKEPPFSFRSRSIEHIAEPFYLILHTKFNLFYRNRMNGLEGALQRNQFQFWSPILYRAVENRLPYVGGSVFYPQSLTYFIAIGWMVKECIKDKPQIQTNIYICIDFNENNCIKVSNSVTHVQHRGDRISLVTQPLWWSLQKFEEQKGIGFAKGNRRKGR